MSSAADRSALFPPAFWEQEYGAALFPFQQRAFYATPPFRRSLMSADGTLQGRANFLQEHLRARRQAPRVAYRKRAPTDVPEAPRPG